jgi:hypothetical protein
MFEKPIKQSRSRETLTLVVLVLIMMLFSLRAFAVIHHRDVQIWLFCERTARGWNAV